MLKQIAIKFFPSKLLRKMQPYYRQIALRRLKKMAWNKSYGELVEFEGYKIRITDGPNFYVQYKDEFYHQIYRPNAMRQNPLIIDGGSNVGLSILFFKKIYPQSRIIGFEPDKNIFKILEENLRTNGIQGVTLVNCGLSGKEGEGTFFAEGRVGGRLEGDRDSNTVPIRLEKLSGYLSEPVDFLKLNIEGEELPVLEEAAESGTLRNVQELVLEYHGFAKEEQRMGKILSLLDQQGFRYLIHDFDTETSRVTKPPFRLAEETSWYCLVYGKRMRSW